MFRSLETAYLSLISFGNAFQPFLLLAIRLFWGVLFLQAGLGKMQNISNVVGFFQELEIPFPLLNAYIVTIVESVGGLCLILGLGSRLVAIPLAITMIVAFVTAHPQTLTSFLADPAEITKESPFTFFLVCLIILAFGPGKFSLDGLIKRSFEPKSQPL